MDICSIRTQRGRLSCLKKAGENISHTLAAVSGAGNERVFSRVTVVIASLMDITVTATYKGLSVVVGYVSKSPEDKQKDIQEALSTVPRAL